MSHFLALLGSHPIIHVSRIRVKYPTVYYSGTWRIYKRGRRMDTLVIKGRLRREKTLQVHTEYILERILSGKYRVRMWVGIAQSV